MGNKGNRNLAKSEKFKTLSEHRVNQILNKIRILGNLANRSNYEYAEEEIARMFRVIDKAIKETREKFNPKRKKDKNTFKW